MVEDKVKEVYNLGNLVREAISGLAQLSPEGGHRGVERLKDGLSSGAWDTSYVTLRSLPECELAYRFLVAGCSP